MTKSKHGRLLAGIVMAVAFGCGPAPKSLQEIEQAGDVAAASMDVPAVCDPTIIDRLLSVMEEDLVPLTEEGAGRLSCS